jgi:hypothetical protein
MVSLGFDMSEKATPFCGSVTRIFQTAKRAGKLPTLILSHSMRQDAFQMDHDRALRGNRAKAGRIAQEAKKATTAVLRRGVCFDATA